jgi:CubicO group peptidase (beta-lactamase class C family)
MLMIAMFMLCVTGCMEESELNRSFKGFTPVDIGDGWIISSPNAEQVDSLELYNIYKDLYANQRSWAVRSFLVFRNGKLIAESYLKSDSDRIRQRAVWSCTKQVVGIVTGIAVNEGYIHSVNDSIKDYLQDEILRHQDKANITISDLLTMRSGLFYKVGLVGDPLLNQIPKNSIDYILGLDLKWQPGTYYNYNTAPPQLISAIIQKTTGMTLAQYADSRFLSRIGVTNYKWEDYPDGVTLGAYGIMMSPRELAKIAQCVCDSGVVNGQQIIPIEWYNKMLTPYSYWTSSHTGFGYYWWVNTSQNFIMMRGRGGQYAIINPDKHIVVVLTSLEYIVDESSIKFDDVLDYAERIMNIAE